MATQRGERRGQGQADLPAEQPAPSPGTWLPVADAHSCRTRDCVRSAPQGSPRTICLIATSGLLAVLPARNRMTRSIDFDATVKHGIRAAQPDVVVHLRRTMDHADARAPRVGLVVGKSVGSAVDRHRVARRLRHVARTLLGELEHSDQLVIRALPTSRTASSAQLEQELRRCLRRVSTTGTRP